LPIPYFQTQGGARSSLALGWLVDGPLALSGGAMHQTPLERGLCLRHYVCPKCGTAVGNREVAMKRLNDWLWLKGRPPQPEATGSFKLRKTKEETPSIICVGCEERVPLWDEMEQCFAGPEIAASVMHQSGRLTPFQQRVRAMQEESAIELSNQSKERALVGGVI